MSLKVFTFKKQSDLVLQCLSRPFWKVTLVCNFETFTIHRLHRKHLNSINHDLLACSEDSFQNGINLGSGG